MDDKIIGHIDMDAFFASVEERDKPWLKGLPIVIGSDPEGGRGRGVVTTANYIARRYGIHSALPIQKAWAFSEEARKRGDKGAVFISPRGRRYGNISKKVFEIVSSYVGDMQVTSVDEAYFDITKACSYKKAKAIAKKIKRDIKKKENLSCSIGIGPNKMIAKIASDFEKPNGLTVVREEETFDFLGPLSIRVIPGIGPKMGEKFKSMKISTIKDARAFSWGELSRVFGSHGFSVYQKVRGSGSTSLGERTIRKSIGQHQTFYEDTSDLKFVTHALEHMGEEIFAIMSEKGFSSFRTIVLTIRFSDFETKNRSITSKENVSTLKVFDLRALKLLLPFFDSSENPRGKKIRMIGLRIEKLK